MIGIMLVNQDLVTAVDGKIIKTESDKKWLANFVKNKQLLLVPKSMKLI